ncbi:MAG TPA: FKBP-type peptidyl-prolyl cis-trans isomerase [Puia sp.]|nr:FKBP-type peptidyl-prolyl cis-trans isomerase [Puia sp.]
MKQIPSYLLALLTLLSAVACKNASFKKTKSGLLYKIISDGKGDPIKKGQFVKLNFILKVRDSVITTTQDNMPLYIRVDSSRADYSPTEIFPLLRMGDSTVVVQIADSLIRKGAQLPPYITKKDKISYIFKVVSMFTSEEAMNADRMGEQDKQKSREVSAVENYLHKNNINAEKTTRGTYVVVQSPGDGPQVDSGKQVSVRYTGKSFPAGKVFESNMSGPGNEPYKFVIGQAAVIQGWDDGLRKFKKGGKGTLYIPAFLAYDQQPGPGRKPYENLIFDIEIVDVTDAPKQAPAGPNSLTPAQQQAMQQAIQQQRQQQQQQHR